MEQIYDISVMDGHGKRQSLKDYEGQILLIVNTATHCGFTPQYEDLQGLYGKYRKYGFEILDFPCNQFNNQAPESTDEIISFCSANFGVEFSVFSKIEVNGASESPLYTFLKSHKSFKGFDQEHPLTPILESMLERGNTDCAEGSDIKWNFTKFLVDRSGKIVERFEATADFGRIEERIKSLI